MKKPDSYFMALLLIVLLGVLWASETSREQRTQQRLLHEQQALYQWLGLNESALLKPIDKNSIAVWQDNILLLQLITVEEKGFAGIVRSQFAFAKQGELVALRVLSHHESLRLIGDNFSQQGVWIKQLISAADISLDSTTGATISARALSRSMVQAKARYLSYQEAQ